MKSIAGNLSATNVPNNAVVVSLFHVNEKIALTATSITKTIK